MNQYFIKNTTSNNISTTTSNNFEPDWNTIDDLEINHFPWYQSGNKQNTHIKICADDEKLFIQIVAQDNYSFAKQTELNNMLICEDSCVEFFFSPSGVLGTSYVNLEVNCCGTLHLAYGAGRENRKFISRESANKIYCQSSITKSAAKSEARITLPKNNNNPIKVENKDDTQWTIEITLPFSVIEDLTGEVVNKDRWFANFYRCGGITDPQYAVWNNIETVEPDYHRPEYFGEIVFSH